MLGPTFLIVTRRARWNSVRSLIIARNWGKENAISRLRIPKQNPVFLDRLIYSSVLRGLRATTRRLRMSNWKRVTRPNLLCVLRNEFSIASVLKRFRWSVLGTLRLCKAIKSWPASCKHMNDSAFLPCRNSSKSVSYTHLTLPTTPYV